MTAPVLPWMQPAVRSLLLADSGFVSCVGGRVSSRLADATQPCATVQATAQPIEVSAGAWSPLVQVDGWCAGEYAPEDPEAVVWEIAVRAAAVLARARNVKWLNTYFSARVVEGPLTFVDESRGRNNPIHRALIRAELIVHAR